MGKQPKTYIVILNWNTWEDTIECLESLYKIDYQNYEVIVIDNSSTDDSIQRIKDYCEGKITINSKYIKYDPTNKPLYVEEITNTEAKKNIDNERLSMIPPDRRLILIRNDKNYGFAEGNNIGIRYALQDNAEYILLLNNDTVVDKDFLKELVNVMEKDRKVGIAGSKIYDYYNPKLIQCSGGEINWKIGKIKEYTWIEDDKDVDKPIERDFVWATSALIRREVFEKVGLLDPYFFFGIEEYDLCARAKKAGFKVVYVPSSKIWHKKGASAKKLEKYKKTKQIIAKQRGFLYYKHFHRLFKKHLPPVIYLFPFFLFLLRLITKLGLQFFKCILSGDIERIKRGLSKWK